MTDFTEFIDLASERLGGAVLLANDEFFAPKENLLKPEPPVFIEGKYTDRGKWMDGWETRRRRSPGHDWCVIRLGLPGRILGTIVDTRHFKGNYPERCSLEARAITGNYDLAEVADPSVSWTGMLPESELRGDSINTFQVATGDRFTHVRFNIFPDGGVARLRIYGRVMPDWSTLGRRSAEIDLASVENGGLVVGCSDMFFGHRHNLIMPGRASDMSDGWETRRRRGCGHDWAMIRLGTPGTIHRLEVDTYHFRGNAPESCALDACRSTDPEVDDGAGVQWSEVLPRIRLQPHTRHLFEDELMPAGVATHVRLRIFPDGGIGRLRVIGVPGEIQT